MKATEARANCEKNFNQWIYDQIKDATDQGRLRISVDFPLEDREIIERDLQEMGYTTYICDMGGYVYMIIEWGNA